jgi:Ca2+/Na+ antiporter
MKLKESQTLWGIPITHLKEHSKKYRLYSSLLYLLDIVLIVLLTLYMYYNNVNYQSYGFLIVVVCLFVHFTTYSFLNPDKWEAFKFYKKYSDCELITKTYDLDEEKMFSMLYCLAFKRLRQGKSFETYKELMLSACCEDTRNAKKLMKYLQKYESESGTLTCRIIIKGKSQYFIDFVNEDNTEELENNNDEGELEDEYDNTGTVTESSTEE